MLVLRFDNLGVLVLRAALIRTALRPILVQHPFKKVLAPGKRVAARVIIVTKQLFYTTTALTLCVVERQSDVLFLGRTLGNCRLNEAENSIILRKNEFL